MLSHTKNVLIREILASCLKEFVLLVQTKLMPSNNKLMFSRERRILILDVCDYYSTARQTNIFIPPPQRKTIKTDDAQKKLPRLFGNAGSWLRAVITALSINN